jgi:hypothetical protein
MHINPGHPQPQYAFLTALFLFLCLWPSPQWRIDSQASSDSTQVCARSIFGRSLTGVPFQDQAKIITDATYYEAEKFCAEEGGRLCGRAELQRGEARAVGT